MQRYHAWPHPGKTEAEAAVTTAELFRAAADFAYCYWNP